MIYSFALLRWIGRMCATKDFCPRCVRRRLFVKTFACPVDRFFISDACGSPSWWVVYSNWVTFEWGTALWWVGRAATIANVSKRSALMLRVERPTHLMNSGDSTFGARRRMPPSWLCLVQSRDDVVATEFGCANLSMRGPAIFDLDVCDFAAHGG